MPYTVVFLWISAGSVGPSPQQWAELTDFGAARGVSFESVSVSSAAPDRGGKVVGLAAYDGARVDRIEAMLEQARTSLSALEEAAATTLLGQVEVELLAHPHLPQAAFLMAECLALLAQAARTSDPARADELEPLRIALEGPRAAAFGEPAASASVPPAQAFRITGLSAIDELELDGTLVSTREPRPLLPGLHHARVWRAGRLVFADFFRISRDQTERQLDVPPLTPCDRDDLAALDVAELARGAAVPAGIACQRWALVRAEGSGIGVAQCAGSRCGSFVHWQRRSPAPFAPAIDDRRYLPTWATFTIVGAAAVAATSIVLWQAGAFDSGTPNAASFRYAGVNPQGIRF